MKSGISFSRYHCTKNRTDERSIVSRQNRTVVGITTTCPMISMNYSSVADSRKYVPITRQALRYFLYHFRNSYSPRAIAPYRPISFIFRYKLLLAIPNSFAAMHLFPRTFVSVAMITRPSAV